MTKYSCFERSPPSRCPFASQAAAQWVRDWGVEVGLLFEALGGTALQNIDGSTSNSCGPAASLDPCTYYNMTSQPGKEPYFGCHAPVVLLVCLHRVAIVTTYRPGRQTFICSTANFQYSPRASFHVHSCCIFP